MQKTDEDNWKELIDLVQSSSTGVVFDEEFDLRMFAFVLNHKEEIEAKGYKVTEHLGLFGFAYVTAELYKGIAW